MDLKDIKAIIDLMKKNSVSEKKNSVSEFELEKQDFKIRLKRGGNGSATVSYEDAPVVTYVQPAGAAPGTLVATPQQAAPAPAVSNEIDIKSPMIGTFYRAPSPESASYVEVGTEVNADTVVCIIEAMKVMNEIKAEMSGVVREILVKNGQAVEFGEPMFLIEKK